mmetsp:Transcript_9757/g.14643  ORF Transcript_9757/g.14643 Transcript_9757/m.14643 type:complete len:764 (+) Transcript_9757:29-2320(+)
MSRSTQGRYRIRIYDICGENLAGKDKGGKSDPYCTLDFDKYRKFQTNVVKKSVNPVFDTDETFHYITMYSNRLQFKHLVISVHDKDFWGKEFIGTAKVDLHTILTGPVEHSLQLMNKGQPAGTIKFKVEMTQLVSLKVNVLACCIINIPPHTNGKPRTTRIKFTTDHSEHKLATETSAKSGTETEWQHVGELRFNTNLKELWNTQLTAEVIDSKGKIVGRSIVPFKNYINLDGDTVDIEEKIEFVKNQKGTFKATLRYSNFPTTAQMIGGIHDDNGIIGGNFFTEWVERPQYVHVHGSTARRTTIYKRETKTQPKPEVKKPEKKKVEHKNPIARGTALAATGAAVVAGNVARATTKTSTNAGGVVTGTIAGGTAAAATVAAATAAVVRAPVVASRPAQPVVRPAAQPTVVPVQESKTKQAASVQPVSVTPITVAATSATAAVATVPVTVAAVSRGPQPRVVAVQPSIVAAQPQVVSGQPRVVSVQPAVVSMPQYLAKVHPSDRERTLKLGLPAPWTCHISNNGRMYYVNHATRQTSWVSPVQNRPQPVSRPVQVRVPAAQPLRQPVQVRVPAAQPLRQPVVVQPNTRVVQPAVRAYQPVVKRVRFPPVNNQILSQLIGMGFKKDTAHEALVLNQNNLAKSVQWLSTFPIPLSPAWTLKVENKSKRIYYSNSEGKFTQWERPIIHQSWENMLRQLLSMGFPRRLAAEALAHYKGDGQAATNWIIFNKPQALPARFGMIVENNKLIYLDKATSKRYDMRPVKPTF